MHRVGNVDRAAGYLGRRRQISVAMVILGSMCTLAGAQIDVNETGLHSGAVVYGVHVLAPEPPYLNEEAISVWAWGETDPDLYPYVGFSAYGLYSEPNLINTGMIDVNTRGGNAAVTDGPAYVDISGSTGIFTLGDADNAGDIWITATGGTAVAGGSYGADASVAHTGGVYARQGANNAGDIEITATAGTATSNDGWADAYTWDTVGVHAEEDLYNTGWITITAAGGTANGLNGAFATSDATGLFTEKDVNNAGVLWITAIGGSATADDDFGIGIASATAVAYGIDAYGDIHNTDSVAAYASGGTASHSGDAAQAYALAFALYGGGNITNSGYLSAAATGGTATGGDAPTEAQAIAYGVRITNGLIANRGPVDVYAEGGTALAGGSGPTENAIASVTATAYGLRVNNGDVDNRGRIMVYAFGGTAVGADAQADAEAYGIVAGGNVNNRATITVVAAAQEGFASYAYGIFMNSTGQLTNTHILRTVADTAYEVYVASGTTTLVDAYNVTLDGDPSQGSFGIANGATLALNDATLTVTPISGETLWNIPYKLFETEGTGAVNGNFADAQAANPNTTVIYDNQGTAGSADDTVALAYTPSDSLALVSAGVEKQVISHAGEVVNRHMTTTLLQNILFPPSSGLLADAGSTAESLVLAEAAPDKTSGVFFEPYYSRMDKDANPLGFDAGLWGFSTGCERYVENTLLGLHLGYGQSDIEYTGRGSGNSEDQDVVTGGFSALTRWDPWTLRYGLTGFYGQHDYEGLTGLALDERETASYDSYGTAATLMAGHIFRRGAHVFLPEAGLDWLWAHRERYTTEATDPSWDTTYSATDDHDVQAVAALRWLSSFLHGDIRVLPSVSVGIRHLLTDAETSVWQSINGAIPVLVKSEQDRTAMTLSGSLTLTRTRHAVSLAYDGDYSPDARQHSIWLRYSWLF